MTVWQVLVDVAAPLPGAEVAALLEAHPSLASVSVHAPPPPPDGWRRALAALGRTRPASVLVAVDVAERAEAERIALAAVAEALARVGVEARLRAASFRG